MQSENVQLESVNWKGEEGGIVVVSHSFRDMKGSTTYVLQHCSTGSLSVLLLSNLILLL